MERRFRNRSVEGVAAVFIKLFILWNQANVKWIWKFQRRVLTQAAQELRCSHNGLDAAVVI